MLGRALDDSYPLEVRRNITALTVARTAANACYRFAPPFLATIARDVDVSLDDIGVALAISELTGLLSPFTGRVVERRPRRFAMAVGLIGVAAGTALAASSTGLVLFAIGLVVLGQSKVVFDLGMGAWLADHVEYERRGRVVGLTETSWAFGLLIGVSTMGVVTGLTSWRVGYGVGAAFVLVMAAVIAKRLPPEPRVHRTTAVSPTSAASAHTASADSPPDRPLGRTVDPSARMVGWAWIVVVGNLFLMAASQFLFVTFGSWLEDDFDFTAATLSAVVFGLGLGELVSSVTSARRTDRWGKEWSAAMGALLMVPSGIGLALWNDQLVVGLVFLVIAICGFEFAIVSLLPIGSQLVPGAPARGIGLVVGMGTLGRAVASVPATRLYDRSGIGWPALLCSLCASGTVLAMLALRRRMAQPR